MKLPPVDPAPRGIRRIVIVGAGGQALVAADIAECATGAGSPDRVIAMVDDQQALHGAMIGRYPVLGPISVLTDIPHDAVVVAVGDNALRRGIADALRSNNESEATLQHPDASIAASATVGYGTMISAGVVVVANASIGRGVILNTRSSVDHDSVVDDFVHIGPGATVGGRCWIGANTVVSIGATVCSGVRIGRDCVVGAGAVVLHDLPDGVRAWGVPARIIG